MQTLFGDVPFIESDYTIDDTRDALNRIVKFFTSLPEQEEMLDIAYCKERVLPMSCAKEHDVFMVDEDFVISQMPQELIFDSTGFTRQNKYLVYSGRLVYPVKDPIGNVMGFCGWDKFVTPKYLDSKTFGYVAKSTTLYGMEKMLEYYKSTKPVFLLEGIPDTHYLRSKGYQSLTALGSHLSRYVVEILRRFGNRLYVIPDNDTLTGKYDEITSGESFVKQVKWALPKAHVMQTRSNKDLDGARKVSEEVEDNLLEDLQNIENIFYPFKELIPRR